MAAVQPTQECLSQSTAPAVSSAWVPCAGVARPNRAAQVAVSKMATSYQPPKQIDMTPDDAAPLSNGADGYSSPAPKV